MKKLLIIAIVFLVGLSQAATIQWSSTTGGDYTNGANWTGGVVPGTNDVASFNLDASYSLALTANVITNSALEFNGNIETVSLNLNSNTLVLVSAGAAYAQSTSRYVVQTNTVTISNGTILMPNNGSTAIGAGYLVSSNTIATLIFSNVTLNAAAFNLAWVNGGGVGRVTWNLYNSEVTLQNFALGWTRGGPSPGTGNVLVNASTLTVTNEIVVADYGNGLTCNLTVTNGTINALGGIFLGINGIPGPAPVIGNLNILENGQVYAGGVGVQLGYTAYGNVFLSGPNALLESGTIALNYYTGHCSLTNNGGVLQFTNASPTITPGAFGNFMITNGTVSFRGITNADVKCNQSGKALDSTNKVAFYGNNTFMLNAATNATTGQAYTFSSFYGTTNWANLFMVNGSTRYRGSATDTLIFDVTASHIISNTAAQIDLVYTNSGAFVSYNSSVTFSSNATFNGTVSLSSNVLSSSGVLVKGALTIGGGATLNISSVTNGTVIFTGASISGRFSGSNLSSNQKIIYSSTNIVVGYTSSYNIMPITFGGYNRSEILTNFPAMVTFTNYAGFLSSSGYDLRFWTNSTMGGTPLNYEIKNWVNNNTSYVWVQVPTLTNNTMIWATWGSFAYNSQAVCTTNGSVWTNMYSAVWHMGQATNPIDSCRFPNDHSVSGGQFGDLTNTFLGYGLNFTNFALLPVQNYGDVSNSFTCSFWYYPRSNGGNTGGGTGYGTLFGDSLSSIVSGFRHRGTVNLILINNQNEILYSPISEYNKWHHFAWRGAIPSSDYPSVITDGSTVTASANPLYLPFSPQYLVGGGYDTERGPDGILTEMRMSTNIMTTNWVWAEYMNMASNTTFQQYGPITTGGVTRTWNAVVGDWWTASNWTPIGVPVYMDDVVINNASAIVSITNSTPVIGWLSSLTISNTATLTFSNWTTSISAYNVNVMGSSLVNCSGPFINNAMSNRVWMICSNLIVSSTASIDVSGKGYGSTTVNSQGQGPGGGFGGGSFDPGGGAYGGLGGAGSSHIGGSPYDSYTNAGLPGSAGGNWSGGTFGFGGGAVWITANGTVLVNGKIYANGKDGSARNAGGSGGGIHIDSYLMAGSGTVSAVAGNCTQYGGGGGSGGRIAVTYNQVAQSNNTPSITFTVASGYGQYGSAGGYLGYGCGDLGTLYFPDTSLLNPANLTHSGKLFIPNLNNWNVNSMTVSNGWLQFTQAGLQLNVTNNLSVIGFMGRLDAAGSMLFTNASGGSSVSLCEYYSLLTNSPSIYVGGSMILTNGGVLALFSAATNGIVDYGALLSVTNDILIYSNSWLFPYSHATNGGSVKIQCRNLNIVDTNAGINADFKGYIGSFVISSAGYGPGGAPSSTYDSGGASYGGFGGTSFDWGSWPSIGYMPDGGPGSIYGSITNPLDAGSAGFNRGVAAYLGSGGGLVRVIATSNVLVNGIIKATGGSALGTINRDSGGSGGSINIRCGTFTGTNGLISANGGSANIFGSGGGGGGRIAIIYTNNSLQRSMSKPMVTFSAMAGLGCGGTTRAPLFDNFASCCGDIGTIYLPDTTLLNTDWMPHIGQLFIPNFTNLAADHLNIVNGWLRIPVDGFNLTITNDLVISGTFSRLELGYNISNNCGQYYSMVTNTSIMTVGGNLILTNNASLGVFAGLTNGIIPYGALISVANDMILYSNCWVYSASHQTNGGSPFFTVGNLKMSGATNLGFNANYRGFGQNITTNVNGSGRGFGFGGGQAFNGTGGGGGGGYGGTGGLGQQGGGSGGTGGVVYGSAATPTDCGSGGGQNFVGVVNLGSRSWGGGLIRIEASNSVTLNGQFLADGYAGYQRDGGGSGGGIFIKCQTLTGTNSFLSARGGAGAPYGGGGGGGGRIAIWRNTDTSSGSSNTVIGLSGGYSIGGIGTVYYSSMIPPFNYATWQLLLSQ